MTIELEFFPQVFMEILPSETNLKDHIFSIKKGERKKERKRERERERKKERKKKKKEEKNMLTPRLKNGDADRLAVGRRESLGNCRTTARNHAQ